MGEREAPTLSGATWQGTYDTDNCPCAIVDGKAKAWIGHRWISAGGPDVIAIFTAWAMAERERAEKAERERDGMRDVAALWQKQAREAAAENANLAAAVESLRAALASMEKTQRATEAELDVFRAHVRGQP